MRACASKRVGQPETIFMIAASGSRRMRATTFSPATRRSAAICSPTVQATPGMVRLMRGPSFSRVSEAACTRKPAAELRAGVPVHHALLTGSTASLPASGSRMMLEKKPDAALFGVPGRTQMVGSRMPTPSRKPLRV